MKLQRKMIKESAIKKFEHAFFYALADVVIMKKCILKYNLNTVKNKDCFNYCQQTCM